ncbi:conserved hypothetical protein [Sporisorium reilianum SRZ2]|uniref:Transcription regulator Rua1 C-terminal domain-containing protein n=1 Tax=Sporisorium reilianum (strain SRZ2) TaxID=999809 RepID=E6ZSC2_SPORE|nr:conserved hypothetical protein [Sporisorium reilianum SRZ2]
MPQHPRYQDRPYQEAPPPSWTPFPSSSSLVNSTTRSTGNGRTSFASTSSSHSASAASLSNSVSSDSLSCRSSPLNEPRSPYEGQPLLSSSSRRYPSAMSHVHQPTSPSSHANPYHHQETAPSRHTRNIEDGSHLWGDGMKGIWNSLTGAPHGKPRSQLPATTSTKGEHLEPARPADVEAATSIWDIPRETVAMAMGFQQGSYEDHSFPSQQGWQQQQQQHPSAVPSYAGAEQQPSHLNYSSSYSNMPAPSGLAGANSDATRSRGSSDAGTIGDRLYLRRPNYQHGRSNDASVDAPHNGQWWSGESHAAVEDPASHYGARRLQPPPLPETRSTSRPTWPNTSGLDMSSYEFPQSSLGKRSYDEEAMAGSAQAGASDANDSAARRYSLTANMSFSRPSASISSMMNNYRPSHADPRRPSLPSDPYGQQQQPTAAASAAAAAQRAGYPSASQWSPWSHAASQPGVAGSMSTSSSSPVLPGWRDNAAMRYGVEASYPSPSGMAGSDKRQQRDRSSSSASAAQQQANVLANTPFHITADIVLRAPAGSKMEDVYYDQHCEMRTGLADPPKSDFDVDNEEDRPRRQTDKLRFPGDLYTPRWVRGSGNAREAWCDRCESGNWLQLKNSQYWYDQVHKHGISSVSGLRFTAPTHLKVYADAAGTVEGKCHQCKEWVLICTAKRRRNFAAFFKHAHACHSYRKASTVGNGPYVEHNPGGHRNGKKESGE